MYKSFAFKSNMETCKLINSITNQVAFLRTSRLFPEDLRQLCVESNKSYVDVANAVNFRTIGIYPVNTSAITGNSYFFTNQRQQSLRRVYTFGPSTADINLGFKLNNISQFVQMSGVYKVDTPTVAFYGLIPATSVAIAGQISFYVTENGASTTSDVIKIVVDAGAPILQSGTIILEWISQP